MKKTPTKRRSQWPKSNLSSQVALQGRHCVSAINGSASERGHPRGQTDPKIPNRRGLSFSSLDGLKSSFQARRGSGDTLVPNRMPAATQRHVSLEFLCPWWRREGPGVVCPNFREIRPIEEPWRNLEDWNFLPVATNVKSCRM